MRTDRRRFLQIAAVVAASATATCGRTDSGGSGAGASAARPPDSKPSEPQSSSADAQRLATARRILKEAPLVDGHNDLAEQIRERFENRLDRLDFRGGTEKLTPPTQTDAPRLRAGGIGGVFLSAFVPAAESGPGAPQYLLEQMDVIDRLVERYPDVLGRARTAADIETIHRSGRVAVLIGIEGGYAIHDSLAVLRQAYAGGARYLTLTHVKHTDWADAAIWPGYGEDKPRHHGLTPFGREVVREMNRLGMLVDLSHVSDETMRAAIDISQAPVIFSHSGARALCGHGRNVSDDVLRSLSAKGGLVMVDFVPFILSDGVRDWDARLATPEWGRLERLYPKDRPRASAEYLAWVERNPPPRTSVTVVADHIDHIRKVAGIDAVGIGSDFDGSESFPDGLEDTSCFPRLLAELLRRGYSEQDVKKVAGLNLLRVFRQAEQVAARLQKERGPSDARISDR
jgi:membrane dipeptidase